MGSPFYYFGPLPRFDSQTDRVQVLAGGYPIGAIVSSSGNWWDVRGGVTDSTPARYRKVFASNNPAPAAQLRSLFRGRRPGRTSASVTKR